MAVVTSVIDLWRWLEPEARLASGAIERTGRPVRGVTRTRASPPHLPALADGALLVVDAPIVADGDLDRLLRAVADAGIDPAAIWVAASEGVAFERATIPLPVVAGRLPAAAIERGAAAHLERGRDELAAFATALRLAAAEAALADPRPSAPAGVVCSRLRRGVAVSVDGALDTLNPRAAGRGLATRFAAAHARLLASRSTVATPARRGRDGLWTLERPISTEATAWLFDDLPFARVDEVALEALAVTLRALLRRRPDGPARARGAERVPPSTGDPLRDTLLAVARANGRIAPAARALGVHRNTVLYRLRRGRAELGIDPRRPDDALRLLRSSEER
jgi:hypothetical protein